MDLADRREQYESQGIDVADVAADPIEQFEAWYQDAEAAGLWEPNATVVSTIDAEGWPTARYVLVKGFDDRGFVFFTNYSSDKGAALDATGRAGLTFGWLPLRRQVRIVGSVERVAETQSNEYFARRPRGSQIGAWASPQSQVVESRQSLDDGYAAIDQDAGSGAIERPPHWGGYRVAPHSIEFWQGRPSRMHDRIRYTREGEMWTKVRLAP
jgi:pyridoxamine 5'-phosphate oxidase